MSWGLHGSTIMFLIRIGFKTQIKPTYNKNDSFPPQYLPYFFAVLYIARTFSVGELSWSMCVGAKQ